MKTAQKSTEGGGFREIINRKPLISGSIIGVVVLVILFLAFKSPSEPDAAGFFSTDDGKTYFPLSGEYIAPFQHDGKEAVGAMIYTCNGKQFVGYLMRYTEEGKKQAAIELKNRNDPKYARSTSSAAYEVKKPGDKAWVRSQTLGGPPQLPKPGQPTFQSVTDVKCPDGKPAAQFYP